MKISTIAFLAAVGTSSAFTTAPSAGRSSRAVASSTELFGRRRAGSTKRATGKKVANPKFGTAEHTDITEDQVRSLFSLWNNALATGDSRIVAKRYAKQSILLPTVSDTPRTDFDAIKDYFDAFLLKQPQGQVREAPEEDKSRDLNNPHQFTMGATGDKVKARYTYVYVYEDNQWKIAHHHSSVMPEGIDIAKPITEDEVKGLFHLWNDALATLDPATVAKRYAKNGVLLPTVSDVPRTDPEGITDYFVNFLQKK
ncbi:hypothetical protein THAOC_17355 [Thalassiosira oceanica]|uniref:SnoaL-like domain-containing protein n=1 Tax=Thalassiosira oceanica TaxID=159749 RepID=K0SM97_THAOC|nr:hypothetical protein THAOC_17355 [Thalassiosira oceanica]|eukprot:EJK62051.1 hypothetical protein THAOC_17355 [Thalassiosira oceanica]